MKDFVLSINNNNNFDKMTVTVIPDGYYNTWQIMRLNEVENFECDMSWPEHYSGVISDHLNVSLPVTGTRSLLYSLSKH